MYSFLILIAFGPEKLMEHFGSRVFRSPRFHYIFYPTLVILMNELFSPDIA